MRLLVSHLIFLLAANVASAQSTVDIVPQIARNPVPYDIGDGPTSIAVVDLNGDHRPELVVINRYTDGVSVLLNNGSGGFSLRSRHATGLAPVCVAASDFNRDGKPDVAVANSGSNNVSILFGSGDGTLGRRADYETGAVPCALASGDLNHDNNPDLVVVNRYGNSVSVLLGRGDGTFRVRTDYDAGRLPYSVAISEVGQDGRPDLVLTGRFDHTIWMLPGNGDGTFRAKVQRATADKSRGMLIDLDADGRPDLAELHRYGYLISLQFGSEVGRPEGRSLYIAGKGPSSILSADVDSDGIADLAVANSGHRSGESGSVSILLGRRNGAFQLKDSYPTGNASHSLAAGDFNGDGKLDLAVANGTFDFGGSVSVLLGHGDGSFGTRTDYATGGYVVWISFSEDSVGASERGLIWTERQQQQ